MSEKSTVKSSTDTTNTTKKSTTTTKSVTTSKKSTAAAKTGINIVGGSGGVFYNENISKTIKDVLTGSGYEFVQHNNTCAGDVPCH